MRRVRLHRRAQAYLSRMPSNRRQQVAEVLREIALLERVVAHPRVKPLGGNLSGQFRARVGGYRVTFVIQQAKGTSGEEEIYVDYVGPRGDAYR